MVDFEKDVINLTEDWDIDIKLNPDYYIHTGILNAQKCLLIAMAQGKTSDGIQGYSIFIKQIEMIARSAGYIGEETLEQINKLKTEDKDMLSKARVASTILGLILQDIFGQKPQFAKLAFNVKDITDEDDETGKIEEDNEE
jgi:hypothetical protein